MALNSEGLQTSTPQTQNPVKKIPFNVSKSYFVETQNILRLLETKFPGKIMTYYVPEKYMILPGHVDYFLEALEDLKNETDIINLLIVSNGGSWEAALRIVSLIRNFCKEFNVIIPSNCLSAATKLTLGADHLYFTPSGFISPVDTQVIYQKDMGNNISLEGNMTSCDSINKAVDLIFESKDQKSEENIRLSYEVLFKYMHPILIGDVIRLSKASERTGKQLMNMHGSSFENQEKIDEIAKRLVYDYPSHGYPILCQEAKELGLPASLIQDKDVYFTLWDLLKYYQVATRAVTTMVGPGVMHVEESSVIIETSNKRITKRFSFDRQYVSSARRWEVLKDNSQWLKIVHADNPNGYKTLAIQEEEVDIKKPENPDSPVINSSPPKSQ